VHVHALRTHERERVSCAARPKGEEGGSCFPFTASLPAKFARLVDTHELHVEEQRLVDQLLVLQDEIERPLARESGRSRTDTLVRRVAVWIAYSRRNDELTDAAFAHTCDALFKSWYDRASPKFKPKV